MYETIMGSVAYGVSDDTSDFDTLGFCIPPKDTLFSHLAGEIEGFGRQKKRFMSYQQHDVKSGDQEIKALLLECLEEHYGDLSKAVVNPDALSTAFREIAAIVNKYERLAA